MLVEEFRYDEDLYADYALLDTTHAEPQILPFVGTPALHNLDWVLTLNTPQFRTFSGSVFYLWGKDENFFEWSPADMYQRALGLEKSRLRVDWLFSYQPNPGDGFFVKISYLFRL